MGKLSRIKAAYVGDGIFGQEWAKGCPKCKYGIVAGPERTGVVSLYLERVVMMDRNEIEFCICDAGTRMESNLKNIRQTMIEDAKAQSRATGIVYDGTHPELATAHRLYRDVQPEPTFHYDGTRVPAEANDDAA